VTTATTVRSWMEDHTKLFLACLDRLADAELDAASALPGWSRRHLVAHVHYNAEALRRLVSWAATGEETPMYGSPEQRAREIEEGSALSAAELRRMVVESARRLSQELDALTHGAWHHLVVTSQGRTVPATEIPWMRTREVAVHAVDLRAGASFTDFPDELTAELLVDVVRRRVSRGEGPDLAAWLTGRAGDPPRLGSWL
jgi:maleylpyruvate isomerase